ncbi:MAG: hypothetical protein Q4Q18_02670 [Methanobrevibacter sp.]|nr:hypothetical protein [Methanobrevibacter sp.]
MSDKGIVIGDDMIQAQLEENSKKLGISLDELIDRYIKRGLYIKLPRLVEAVDF